MNHPLSRNELERRLDDNSESPEGTPVPSWLTQHYRDDDAEFLVNQYRRKQEEEPGSLSASRKTGPTSITAAGSWRRQREQLADVQMDRAPMPQVPSRPTIPASELEVQHRHYGSDRELSEPVSYSSYLRPAAVKKSLLFAGVFAAVAGGAVGFAVTKYDQISQSANDLYAFAGDLACQRFGDRHVPFNRANDNFEKAHRHRFP